MRKIYKWILIFLVIILLPTVLIIILAVIFIISYIITEKNRRDTIIKLTNEIHNFITKSDNIKDNIIKGTEIQNELFKLYKTYDDYIGISGKDYYHWTFPSKMESKKYGGLLTLTDKIINELKQNKNFIELYEKNILTYSTYVRILSNNRTNKNLFYNHKNKLENLILSMKILLDKKYINMNDDDELSENQHTNINNVYAVSVGIYNEIPQ